MQQAADFRDECETLYGILKGLDEREFSRETLFKSWTINDIIAHLHIFDYFCGLSLTAPDRFGEEYQVMVEAQKRGQTLRQITDKLLNNLAGHELLHQWKKTYIQTAGQFSNADPKQRVKWAGPDMSARSSISARLMETWSHGQAIYDLLGVERVNSDRIKNIVIMGVNTFGWTFINRGEEVPKDAPYLRLVAPSGEVWQWNDAASENSITGLAEEFCQVVTQSSNVLDTKLSVTGDIAQKWMAVAQCFAGPANAPPAPGARHINNYRERTGGNFQP